MTSGQVLTLISYKDVVINRCFVAVENGVYFVCKQEEYDEAIAQGREPICIGFKEKDLLSSGDGIKKRAKI